MPTFVPVLCIFYFVQRYFQSSSVEIKRLDAISRSPVYSFFGQCLDGMSCIRAYGSEEDMFSSCVDRLDKAVMHSLV